MGRRLSYPEEIKESVEELRQIEKRQKKALFRDRVRYIRLLKSGEAQSQKAASSCIGGKVRQGQRNWRMYREGGMEGLLRPPRPGRPPKLKPHEEKELKVRLKGGGIQFLHGAVAHVKGQYKQDFSLVGMHYLFKRMKVKKKTGRPVNIRQDKDGPEGFKKTTVA